MAYRQVINVVLVLITTLFFCFAIPVMANSNGNAGTAKHEMGKASTHKATGSMVMVNVNTASGDELTELVGVGPKIAEKIIAYREQHGNFKQAEDLLNIKGIGEKVLAKIKDQLEF